jgi:hypothetical protein
MPFHVLKRNRAGQAVNRQPAHIIGCFVTHRLHVEFVGQSRPSVWFYISATVGACFGQRDIPDLNAFTLGRPPVRVSCPEARCMP